MVNHVRWCFCCLYTVPYLSCYKLSCCCTSIVCYIYASWCSHRISNTFLAGSSFKSSNSDALIIGLSDNELSGTVPSTLAKFENLFISLGGNGITGIDQSLCNKSSWMNGDVAKFGCDAILCPEGTNSTLGRMRAEFNKCFPCKNSLLSLPYMGSTKCVLSQQKILSYFWETFFSRASPGEFPLRG